MHECAQVRQQLEAAEAACGLPVPATRRHWRMRCDLAAEEASLALMDDRCGRFMEALCLRLQVRAVCCLHAVTQLADNIFAWTSFCLYAIFRLVLDCNH